MKSIQKLSILVFIALLIVIPTVFIYRASMKISSKYRIKSLWENYENAQMLKLRGVRDVESEDLDKIIELAEKYRHDNEWLKAIYRKTLSYPDHNTRIDYLNQKISESRKPLDILLGITKSSLIHGWMGSSSELAWYHEDELQLKDNMLTRKRLFMESDLFYREMLKSQNLRKIKVKKYKEYLEFRFSGYSSWHIKNLYDFVAWQAVGFYRTYELEKEILQLFSPDSFTDLDFFLKNADSKGLSDRGETSTLYALRLLLESMRKGRNKTGITAANVYRYEYLYRNSDQEETNSVFVKRLSEIIEDNPRYPEISQVYYRISEILCKMGKWEEAYEYARNCPGGKDDRGSRDCMRIINDFNGKYLKAWSDSVVPGEMIKYSIEYRNIDKIFIRISEKEFNINDYINYRAPSFRPGTDMGELFEEHYIMEIEIKLKATKFYEIKKAEFELPELPTGLYNITISSERDIDKSGNVLTSRLLVSNIKCIARSKPNMAERMVIDRIRGIPVPGNVIDGLVVDSMSGMPVPGAEIILYKFNNEEAVWLSSTKSDNHGYYAFINIYKGEYLIAAKSGTDFTLIRKRILMPDKYSNPPGKWKRTLIMTDRSLYKPGQAILFKGVLFDVDYDNNTFSILPHEPVKVTLHDDRFASIDSQEMWTTIYGSFRGSFKIPESAKTGRMSVGSNYRGSAFIGVYDHKKPELYIDIEENNKVYILNDTVNLSGRVADSDNRAMAHAKIEYFVFIENPVKEGDYRNRTVNKVKKGRLMADRDGRFDLEFDAVCDLKEYSSSNYIPFNVYITAFSSDGRKRSVSKSIDIGFRDLFTRLVIDDYIVADNSFEISLDFHNHINEQIPIKGILKIYRISVPGIVEEDTKSEWGYDPEAWDDGNLVFETEFNTYQIASHKTQLSLDAGLYRIRIMEDNKLLESIPLIVVPHPSEKKFPVKIPFYSTINRSKLKKGEQFIMTWGTDYDDGRAYIEISKDNKILRSYWTGDDATYHTEKFTITERMAGGFSAAVCFVHSNRTYTKTYIVDVPYPKWDMEADFGDFAKRLIKGEDNLIELRINKGTDSINPAEMVATIYDSSYDNFFEHNFTSPDFLIREKDSSVYYITDEYQQTSIIKGRADADIITRPRICWYPANPPLHPGRNKSLPRFFKEDPCILDDIEEAVYFNPSLMSGQNDLIRLHIQPDRLPAEMRLLGFIHTIEGMCTSISIDL